MSALGYLLDFGRTYSDLTKIHSSMFIPSETCIQRVKRYLSKKMKSNWREVLSVDYLNSTNCWANLEELQKVIPHHSDIVAALFPMVKTSRPMTYQFLTVQMLESINENEIIN